MAFLQRLRHLYDWSHQSKEMHMATVPPKQPQRQGADKIKPHQNRNLKQQGRQGNIKQNTTNQGYQQDR